MRTPALIVSRVGRLPAVLEVDRVGRVRGRTHRAEALTTPAPIAPGVSGSLRPVRSLIERPYVQRDDAVGHVASVHVVGDARVLVTDLELVTAREVVGQERDVGVDRPPLGVVREALRVARREAVEPERAPGPSRRRRVEAAEPRLLRDGARVEQLVQVAARRARADHHTAARRPRAAERVVVALLLSTLLRREIAARQRARGPAEVDRRRRVAERDLVVREDAVFLVRVVRERARQAQRVGRLHVDAALEVIGLARPVVGLLTGLGARARVSREVLGRALFVEDLRRVAREEPRLVAQDRAAEAEHRVIVLVRVAA